jgi:hypothetical protein
LKGLKCGAAEGWRRSVGPIVRKMEKHYTLRRVKNEKNILYTVKGWKVNWIGHILRRNCLLNLVIEGKIKEREDEEEDVSSYWMTLRKREDTRRRTH